jgi:polysaccharide deacetylase 2 family uncharacterized protein YibQ
MARHPVRPSKRPRGQRLPSRKSGGGAAGFGLFLLGALLGAGILYLACFDSSSREARKEPPARPVKQEKPAPSHRRAAEPTAASDTAAPSEPAQTAAFPVPSATPPAAERPRRIALVIDDLGRSVDDLVPLEKLGVPITYAVLPFEENTPTVVSYLHNRREEVILHLPMEPKHGQDPGPGALRVGMTDDQLRTGTLAALQAVPGAVGVNNHMGSSLSADARSMSTILQVISSRGLFFLDSRTSSDSVGYRTALSLGVPAAERQVFLDSDPGPEAVHGQFVRLLDMARTRGAAVAIGHPHPDTLAALTAEVPKAKALGYDFVPVSYLLDRSGGPE